MREEISSGGVIVFGNAILLLKKYNGDWVLPKGKVEPGEKKDEAALREVFEESGLKIKNIRYIGSQPWSFPNSLMLGFLADYDSGEIRIQKEELNDAAWFKYDSSLPTLPPQGTIARKLIEMTQTICDKENKKQ